MAGSQLKRLKESLRTQGIIGPQQSKKQKKRNAQDEKAKSDKRLSRTTKLEGIREQFNPFDLKHNVRGPKFDVTSNRPATGNAAKGIYGRPTEARAAAEERRKETLLVEMQRRQKVGGLVDRRFGEDDANMTPEEKALERFALEKQRSHKRAVFDLEDDDAGESFGLTHMGKSLSLDGPNIADDYEEDDMDAGSDDDDEGRKAYLKRKLMTEGETEADDDDDQPERKKTKAEVMKEVIAKSKYHKAERQAAKEADEDLRMELDEELPNLRELLFKSGKDKDSEAKSSSAQELQREYDLQVRSLAADRRAAPTDRTKTEEEQAEDEARKLRELEEKRQRRMEGKEESESEAEDESEPEDDSADGPIQFIEKEEGDTFGLGKGIKLRPTATQLGFDDEDDFFVEDNLIAEGSDLSLSEVESEDDESDRSDDEEAEEEEDEFTRGILNEEETKNPAFSLKEDGTRDATTTKQDADGLPYVFSCPETHEALLSMTKTVPVEKLPIVVQRIRALHHSKLDSANKSKLGNFARVLIQHLPYLATHGAPFAIIESLVRHVHSMAKTYPVEIANELRSHIEDISTRPLDINVGDLIILTIVGTIFPTSDHFHQVATPAMLTMNRYLGMKIPRQLTDYTIGSYLCILAVQYQTVSKRYIPEVMNFSLNTLAALAPVSSKERLGLFPLHEPVEGTRIQNAKNTSVRKLSCLDCTSSAETNSTEVKIALADTTVKLLDAAATVWTGKAAFYETFQPALAVLNHLSDKACRAQLPKALNQQIGRSKTKLESLLQLARMERRNLELHHHKPLAIKTHVPKFEDQFDPDKHYDPDRERAEANKLKAEHKKERKGAMRELRKDANFMAREKLRIKKARDTAYEKKFKRIVAEIQSEEGRESNAYEREKAARKRAAKSR
ncbi:nucleolar complex protein 14 [Pestalotiopsis sp. 9143b]|nr:nucleolar complex protein 14 [Pestalotiopsis sp. 9143b]